MSGLGAKLRQAREQGVPLVMPSGETFRVRPVTEDTFIRMGRVPDLLMPVIQAAFEGRQGQIPEPQTEAQLRDYVNLLDTFTELCLVEPRIVPADKAELSDNECTVADIDLGDKVFLMSLMGANAKALETFRQQQALDVGSVDTGETTASASESAAGRTPDADAGSPGLVDAADVRQGSGLVRNGSAKQGERVRDSESEDSLQVSA